MITNDPNTNLIEAMKEKLPLKGKLADMLMDTLYIGKEAVYRRLRGEVLSLYKKRLSFRESYGNEAKEDIK